MTTSEAGNVQEARSEPIAIGDAVSVTDVATGARRSLVLVLREDSSPRDGRVSIESPLGQALFRRRAGDVVEVRMPAGTRRLRVTSVGVA
jgi:transcription elongation factor GreA